jgi:hypothetical protein
MGASHLLKTVIGTEHIREGVIKTTRSTIRADRTSFVRNLFNSQNIRVFDDCVPTSHNDVHALGVARKMVIASEVDY